jgi:hypothetical protein
MMGILEFVHHPVAFSKYSRKAKRNKKETQSGVHEKKEEEKKKETTNRL